MIRVWEEKDSIQLRKLIKGLLVNQSKFGSRVLPSEANISWYIQLGYMQIKNGDPHLVYEEDGKILGYLQVGATMSVLEIKEKTAEFYGLYCLPEARGKFISIELTREMGLMAVKQGYTYIYSTILLGNAKNLKNMFYNPAIWPTSVHLDWCLENDPQFQDGEFIGLIERKTA